jgi:NodT family efflux transporter outer membrane factor (OMF) lipoprotein
MNRLLLSALLALLVGGCLMHDVDTNPKAPLELPAKYRADDKARDPGPWWTRFSDRQLELLIDRALAQNFSLRQAWARLAQAKALERGAAAGFFPRVDASLSAGRSQSPPRVFSFGGAEQTIPGVESDSFSASLPVSYEVDLWGRVRAGYLAAEQDTLAARLDLESAATTVAANITERWFDVLEQRALSDLLGDQIDINQLNLELVELRFTSGDSALADVEQQRQQIQLLEAQLALTQGQEQVAAQQLALLVSASPRELVGLERRRLPEAPLLPEGGIPASLVEKRPDVRAAKARVVAADYRVAQAIAARLPQLTLSGSLGFNSTALADFFEAFIWSITGSISGTIWDGGRLDSEIDRSKAVVDERLAAYGQALLTALVEVESALVNERVGRERLAILERQVATARNTLESARERFSAGIGDYLTVLTALRSLQQAEQTLLNTRRQLLSQRVQIYRALGSRWTSRLELPESLRDSEE